MQLEQAEIGQDEKHSSPQQQHCCQRAMEQIRLDHCQNQADKIADDCHGATADGCFSGLKHQPIRLKTLGKESCTMESKNKQERQPTEDGIRRKQVQKTTLIDHMLINRQTTQKIRDRYPPEDCRNGTAKTDCAFPEMPPAG